jgi:hypothetical protein
LIKSKILNSKRHASYLMSEEVSINDLKASLSFIKLIQLLFRKSLWISSKISLGNFKKIHIKQAVQKGHIMSVRSDFHLNHTNYETCILWFLLKLEYLDESM